ncbi:hypothetical protein KA005_10855 [bacterium]|nr:hypothetical protein [bacterium]
MTRRYPVLKKKVAERDSKIAKRLIQAWDQEKDSEKVLYIFLKEKHLLSHYRYWELMRTVWIIAGSVETAPIFRELMISTRPQKHYFSTPEEANTLRSLPDKVRVYRAQDGHMVDGISWTLTKEYAELYQQQFHKEFVYEREVDRESIFAYINRNGEEELIIL